MREILSGENKTLSSKRVMGSLVMGVCMYCIVYLVIKDGGTSVVENLLQTAMITAGGLLGVSTISNIWRKPNKHTPHEEHPTYIDPCDGCPHQKKEPY